VTKEQATAEPTTYQRVKSDWNQMTRVEQIQARHQLWSETPLPDSEYAASWADIEVLLSEVAQLRTEALKGICVYCGYIERYESLEQKASEEGNAMRVAHIQQCPARPEAKLIAFSQQLIDEVAQLRGALNEAWTKAILLVHTAPLCHCAGKQYIDPVALVQRMTAELEDARERKDNDDGE
jgi:hypothetical protein